MKRIVLVAALGVGLTTQVAAQPSKFAPLAESLFRQMTLTYMCREALGGLAHYQAARTIAVDIAGALMGARNGMLTIDAFERKIISDPRTRSPVGSREQCQVRVNEGLHIIELEKARAGL